MRRHDDTADSAVAYQQIASQTHPGHRYFRRQLANEGRQIHDVARRKEEIRRTSRMPGSVFGHGYIVQHAAREFRRQLHQALRTHGCAPAAKRLFKSCETAPKLPAPMVSTRSPSCKTARSDSARSSTLSTNTGSM